MHSLARFSRSSGSTPWFLFPLVLLLYFWRRGYVIGAGDQDETLPLVLHRLNPDLFQADWFVQTQAAGWTIRSYFLFLVEAVSMPIGVEAAVTLLYVIVWVVLGYYIYLLSLEFVDSRAAAAGTVVLALSVCLGWTLGGNDFVQMDLAPEMVGWAFAVPGFVYFLRDRTAGSAMLLGVAAWFHPLVGMLSALLLGLVLFVDQLAWYKQRLARKQLVTFTIAFLVLASPTIIPIAVTEFFVPSPETPATPTVFYLLAEFRLPHHHLFHSFSPRSAVLFSVLVIVGVISLVLLMKGARIRRGGFIAKALGVIAFLCIVAYFFTEVVPVPAVSKMQFFKLTVLAKVLLIVPICGLAATFIGGHLQRSIDGLLDNARLGWTITAVAGLVTAVLIMAGVSPAFQKFQPLSHRASDLYAIESWAREHTDERALFVTPPGIDSFRYHARRSVLVNFKSFPFQEPLMYVWYQRLMEIAPIEPPERGTGILPVLDAAYHRNPPERWRSLHEAFDIDYVLVHRSRQAHIFDEPPVFESGDWAVYQLSP